MQVAVNQLAPNEEVIASLQNHWISLLKPFLLLSFSWLVFFLLFTSADFLRTTSTLISSIILIIDFFILIVSHHFFFLFLLEYLISSMVVTNQRLIEINFFPFVRDDVSYIEIKEIHEIEKKKHGIFKNILNYGEVQLNIPRKAQPVLFKHIWYPSKFVSLIEAIRFGKNLSTIDLKNAGADCPEKYKFLLKK